MVKTIGPPLSRHKRIPSKFLKDYSSSFLFARQLLSIGQIPSIRQAKPPHYARKIDIYVLTPLRGLHWLQSLLANYIPLVVLSRRKFPRLLRQSDGPHKWRTVTVPFTSGTVSFASALSPYSAKKPQPPCWIYREEKGVQSFVGMAHMTSCSASSTPPTSNLSSNPLRHP